MWVNTIGFLDRVLISIFASTDGSQALWAPNLFYSGEHFNLNKFSKPETEYLDVAAIDPVCFPFLYPILPLALCCSQQTSLLKHLQSKLWMLCHLSSND